MLELAGFVAVLAFVYILLELLDLKARVKDLERSNLESYRQLLTQEEAQRQWTSK